MHPILFKIGNFALHTYGLMIAVGFFAALEVVIFRAKEKNIAENLVIDLFFYTVIGGLLGGRILYVLLNLGYYLKNPLDIVKVWEGGMVFYGGFILAFVTAVFFVRLKKMNLYVVLDIFSPGVALAHFFGRLGCFFAGCCYGKACSLPWAVTFKNPESLAPLNAGLHPTQLYEAILNLMIFFGLIFYGKKKPSDGKIFFLYLIMYGVMRFSVEFLRGDERGFFLFGLSVSQLVSLLLIIFAVILWKIYYKNEKTAKS